MPLPTPRSGESQGDFVGRCVGNDQAKRDFPDRSQRLAVCLSRFRRVRGGEPPSKSAQEMYEVLEPILKSMEEEIDGCRG